MPRVVVASATRCTARPYAARRIDTPRLSIAAHVSLNARVMMSFSFAFTSVSFQKYSWRPWTHSKYDTTTPPALARTSGRTTTPASSRISSAAGVVGQSRELPGLELVREGGGDVDPVRVVDASRGVGHRDHGRTFLGQELRQVAA